MTRRCFYTVCETLLTNTYVSRLLSSTATPFHLLYIHTRHCGSPTKAWGWGKLLQSPLAWGLFLVAVWAGGFRLRYSSEESLWAGYLRSVSHWLKALWTVVPSYEYLWYAQNLVGSIQGEGVGVVVEELQGWTASPAKDSWAWS